MSAPIWGRFSTGLIGVLQLEGVAPMAVARGEPVAAGGRAAAVTRHRADAALLAASLPALAVPNRLRLAEKGKGASCLALAVESLDGEELPSRSDGGPGAHAAGGGGAAA